MCGCLSVNGNAHSEIGLKSLECKNPDCFQQSKANRGKRFSLKTIMTQGRQEKRHAIEQEFIKKWRRDIIKINPVIKINSKGENKLGHTAPFPVEIPEMAVKLFSYENEIVLDPFGGNFTSVIVAKQLGRVGIGIELNKEMFKKSIRNNLQNKLKLFNNLKIEEFDYNDIEDKKKLIIGLYGEMRLSMELHELGWQVHRAYIDEGIDFTITKYWCPKCKKYSNQFICNGKYNVKNAKCVTNLCEYCHKTELEVVSRYLQVKTSEGKPSKKITSENLVFTQKLGTIWEKKFFMFGLLFLTTNIDKICRFYILNTKDIEKFDNIKLPIYQIIDNQKTTLKISVDGIVLNKGKECDYSCFNKRFYNDWRGLELELR